MGSYILALMFLVGGAIVTLLGRSNLVRTRRKRAAWVPCEGIVTEIVQEYGVDSRGKPLYAPVYRYAADGREYTAKSNIAARPARYRVGDRIPVLVNPTKPNDSEVLDRSISAFTYGMMAMGLLVFAVGLLLSWLTLTGRVHFD